MGAKLNLDKLDLQIINAMMDNAEISYAELGKKLFVSVRADCWGFVINLTRFYVEYIFRYESPN